jgi:hypothetical protein
MDIPIANQVDNKIYIYNAKLQEVIYYDPEINSYSNNNRDNYYCISSIIISSIFFYVLIILYEINNRCILEKKYNITMGTNSTILEHLTYDNSFTINYG